MLTVYVIELENNKYYIGKTHGTDTRISDHFNSSGSAWTRKYKPVKVIETISNCDDYDEDKYVLKYMNQYGIENVRGASYSQVVLSDSTIKSIQSRLDGINDRCFNCGQKGHFISQCKVKKEECLISNIDEIKLSLSIDSEQEKIVCERCFRNNHTIENCFAKKDLHGHFIRDPIQNRRSIDNNVPCELCGGDHKHYRCIVDSCNKCECVLF